MQSFAPSCLLLVTCLAAQQPVWQLPKGGLATFLASEGLEPEPANGHLPGCSLPHAPVLLQSELAADGRSVAMEPQDWRWIAPLLAFDLRLGKPGKVELRLARVPGLGDLTFAGTAQPVGDDGHQQFELRWQVQPPALRPGEKALVAGGKPLYGGSGKGTLQLDRKVDAARGVVEEFAATLALDVAFGPFQGNGKLAGTWSQHWVLRSVQGHREASFETRVAEAIRNGCLSIQHALQPERPEFATQPAVSDHPCGEGRLALAIQTLLVAGHSPTDAVLVQALAELRRRDIRETYSLAVAILAIEQQYAPSGERDSLLAGGLQHPAPRTPNETDRALLTEWRQRLLQNRDSSVDNAYRSRFWYLGGKGFDNSNSQYALLGLWSAQLCQLPTDRGVWLGAAEHWLAAQHPAEGKPRGLQLTDLQVLREKGLTEAGRGGSSRTAVPRGFSYTLPGSEAAYGSMTCAGLTGLALCMAALATDDGGKSKPNARLEDARLEDALRNGFAWLSQNRTVRWNAGAVPHRSEFYFYWLYSLERACELSRIGLIDGWDWYHDGAQVLLALQDDNGCFGDATLEEQCLAVLFLKKAQLPAITGSR
jgi:hypothetical protein